MADDARQTPADLKPTPALTEEFGFFELLRRLESDGRRFGRAGGPDREPARLGQAARLAFSTRDVAAVEAEAERPPTVRVEVVGLLGPEGPMPLHLTRWILSRLSNRWFAGGRSGATTDTAFLDFCNMLQHRLLALYWRAWGDARPEVQIAHGSGGRATAPLRALAGLGLPGAADRGFGLGAMRHATSLAREVRGPERLTRFLADVIGAPVALHEYVGMWSDLPPRLQSRLGQTYAGLGTAAVLGRRSFDRQNRAELRVGPLGLRDFLGFLRDGARREALRRALVFAGGHDTTFDLRLVLRRAEVPPPRLGEARLGQTLWLGAACRADPDDARLRAFAGRPCEAAA